MVRTDEADELIRRRADLLAATECVTLKDLALLCEDGLDGDFTIEALSRSEGPGLMMSYAPGWDPKYYSYCIYYPFPLDEFWEAVHDFGAQNRFDTGLEWLAREISAVEGFEVVIGTGGDDISRRATLRVGLRTTVFGFTVQDLPDYPYKRRMAGSFTVDEWRARRFTPLYPGLTVDMRDGSDDSVTLGVLRGEEPPAARAHRRTR